MIATWHALAFPVFGHRPASLEAARTMGRVLEAHGRTTGPRRLVEITLLDAHAPMPPADVREALDAMVPRVSPYYAGVSAIFEGGGFRAAMIRGILTGFQLLSRNKYPQKVFATPEECAAWALPLARESGMALDEADAIVEAIRAVREEGVRRGILTQPTPEAHPA
jgi:hypothetical protein